MSIATEAMMVLVRDVEAHINEERRHRLVIAISLLVSEIDDPTLSHLVEDYIALVDNTGSFLPKEY